MVDDEIVKTATLISPGLNEQVWDLGICWQIARIIVDLETARGVICRSIVLTDDRTKIFDLSSSAILADFGRLSEKPLNPKNGKNIVFVREIL